MREEDVCDTNNIFLVQDRCRTCRQSSPVSFSDDSEADKNLTKDFSGHNVDEIDMIQI